MKALFKFKSVFIISALLVLSGCNIVDGITGKNKNQKESIHPVLLNGKWGFINQKGEVVLSPQFDEARDESNGFAAVRLGTLWGIVKADPAAYVVSAKFATLGDFENGLAPAQLPGGQFGYVDESGEFVSQPQFDFASKFSNGFAAVRIDGLWGYINATGEIAIDPAFSDARAFSEKKAAVQGFEGWYYIDESGNSIINPSFLISNAREFVNDMAPVQTVDGWGFINKSGNPVITPSFSDAGNFSESRAWVSQNNYIGFINTKGQFLIEPQFSQVKSFSENMAAVRLNNSWFYINRSSGRISINKPFTDADSFRNGIARIQEGTGENARFGYIDKKGDYVWYPTN